MVLKGLLENFNPFSIYATHSSKELQLLEFKTQLESFENTQNTIVIRVMIISKLISSFLSKMTVNGNFGKQEAWCFTCDLLHVAEWGT